MSDKKPKEPAYYPVVVRFLDKHGVKPGQVHEVTILHDDWCAMLVTGGVCNCNPEVRHGPPKPRP